MSIQRLSALHPSLCQNQPAWLVEKLNPSINAILHEMEMRDKLAGTDIEWVRHQGGVTILDHAAR